jgi:2-dehydropantoate 2-reductase
MVAVDPTARSSMWDDLEHGRTTEIDYLQGEIVALADRLRRPAPVNRRVVELVRVAEAGGRRDYTGAELAALVLAA